jgi:phage tail-like protein
MSDPGTSTTLIPDYYASKCFWIELDGVIQAYFLECTGLSVSTETYKVKEGGLNSHVHHLPDRTNFSNITLKNGYTLSDNLWIWYKNTALGTVQKKNVTIILYDAVGTVTKRWQLTGAYPIKWTGPSLNSKSNDPMTESVELVYDFFQLAAN